MDSGIVKIAMSAMNIAPITTALYRLIGRESTVRTQMPTIARMIVDPVRLEFVDAERHRTPRVQGEGDRDDEAGRDREAQRPTQEPRDVALRVRHEGEEERRDADRQAVGDRELTRQERELHHEDPEQDRESGGVRRLGEEQHRDALDVGDHLPPLCDDIGKVRELPVQQDEDARRLSWPPRPSSSRCRCRPT